MADLSNLKIANTFSRLLQVDPDTTQLQDGVGDNPSTIIFNGTTLKYVDGNQQNNYILTSDADGVARWAANSGGGGGSTDVYWSASSLNANAIVNSGMTNSKVGIGTLTPNHTLSVSGTVSASSHMYAANLRLPGTGIVSFDNSLDGTDQFIRGNDNNIIIDGDDYIKNVIDTEFWIGTSSSSPKFIVDDEGNVRADGTLVVTGNTVMNGTLSASSVNVGNGDGSVSAATITASGEIDGGSLDIEGDADINGTTNLDNTDIDGTLVVDGTNISLDSTSTLNIDNSNTSNGITIGTATSGVPIQLGHSTSNVRINDNLIVTGNTVMNGTLSATTSCKVGNGNGTISAATINGVTINGTTVEGTIDGGTF